MRLFVALDPNDAVRARIAELLRELEPLARGIKWVRPHSMHLTLKFLGEQPENKLPALLEALAAAPTPGPLELKFRGLGCFPNDRHPRVFWLGVEAPPELAQLAADVDRAMEPLGIEREPRKFSAHLTIGRLKEGGNLSMLWSKWEAHRADDFGQITAPEFFLYQSRLSPAGAEYTKLRAFPLSGPSHSIPQS